MIIVLMAVMTIGSINDVRGDVSSVVSNLGAPDNEVIEEEPNGIIDFSQARITLFALAGHRRLRQFRPQQQNLPKG